MRHKEEYGGDNYVMRGSKICLLIRCQMKEHEIGVTYNGRKKNLRSNLTFIEPCILILFLKKNQLDAPMYQIYFILE